MMKRVYTPEPYLRHPGELVVEMWRDILSSRELAWRLTVRNISALYRQTYFGYLWAFLPPIATTVAFLFLKQGGVVSAGDIAVPYAAYLLISTSLWQLFADAVVTPLRVVTASKAMLIKINFQREALIIASIAETLFNFFVRLSLVLFAMLWYGVLPAATVWLVPLGLLALLAAGTVVGLLLTPLGLLYQDIQKGLPMVLNFWMLLTPVVYAAGGDGIRDALMKWNPISPLLATTRDWLLTGQSTFLLEFCLVGGAAFALLILGWVLYRVAMPHVIARLGG
ncbi:MAG: ABC transporter permease [Verrucomicrobiota bacterium]